MPLSKIVKFNCLLFLKGNSAEMLQRQPLRLVENRVWRLYTGGYLPDRFLGKKEGCDEHFPEDWIGSTVAASNPNRNQCVEEGLSWVFTHEGETRSLISVLQEDPENLLGIEHYRKYGVNLGVLIKLLDAAIRLPIQVHPTKELAKKYFNLSFGKTEAWIVLATRKVRGIEPNILLGFRKGVSRELFVDLLKLGDSEALEKCLHRIPVKEGDVFLIEAGIPHAIGAGNFILEIQEPTDITLRAEKNVGDIKIDEEAFFQGLSLQEYLDCYSFHTRSERNILKRYQLNSRLRKDLPGYGKEHWLIGYEETPCFAVRSIEIESFWKVESDEEFHILLIIEGKGCLSGRKFSLEINKGDSFFIPYHLAYQINKLGVGPLRVITCWAPKPN